MLVMRVSFSWVVCRAALAGAVCAVLIGLSAPRPVAAQQLTPVLVVPTDGLTAGGPVGDDWNRGNLQVDLSYPLMRFLYGNLGLYLYAQYFLGYGESVLYYNERSSAFRLGFALYR